MRCERLELLVFRQRAEDIVRIAERILGLGQPLDERGPPSKRLGELVGGQLPR